jgi:hypothetical protein
MVDVAADISFNLLQIFTFKSNCACNSCCVDGFRGSFIMSNYSSEISVLPLYIYTIYFTGTAKGPCNDASNVALVSPLASG